jgi:hypothetical protein
MPASCDWCASSALADSDGVCVSDQTTCDTAVHAFRTVRGGVCTGLSLSFVIASVFLAETTIEDATASTPQAIATPAWLLPTIIGGVALFCCGMALLIVYVVRALRADDDDDDDDLDYNEPPSSFAITRTPQDTVGSFNTGTELLRDAPPSNYQSARDEYGRVDVGSTSSGYSNITPHSGSLSPYAVPVLNSNNNSDGDGVYSTMPASARDPVTNLYTHASPAPSASAYAEVDQSSAGYVGMAARSDSPYANL